MRPLVQMLYNAGVEAMLAGHDHDYERFAPQNLDGVVDTARGIVQFVAGTGGSNNTPWTVIQPNSLVRQNTAFGVLKFTLHADQLRLEVYPGQRQLHRFRHGRLPLRNLDDDEMIYRWGQLI